jgi:hypothetical protein
MGNDRLTKTASTLVLLGAVLLAPGTASAGGPKHPGKSGNHPSVGMPTPMPVANPFPEVIVDATCPACCYTVPIQAVYQCPAVIAGQPGSQVRYLRPDPRYGLFGGQPFLYHQ